MKTTRKDDEGMKRETLERVKRSVENGGDDYKLFVGILIGPTGISIGMQGAKDKDGAYNNLPFFELMQGKSVLYVSDIFYPNKEILEDNSLLDKMNLEADRLADIMTNYLEIRGKEGWSPKTIEEAKEDFEKFMSEQQKEGE